MNGKRKELISLLVISNVLLFGAGLFLGASSSNLEGATSELEGAIRVYKMEMEISLEGFPIYGPGHVELNGTFETDDGVIGIFPSENISWNSDVFNITIDPSLISTYFGGEINITTGEDIWYFGEWLIIIRK